MRLRAELRAFGPDVLHTIMWPANAYGRLAALRLGIPAVVAAERVVLAYRRWHILLDRALDRVTDAYLVNCEAVAAWMVERERLASSKITVIPNGIDLGRFPAFSLDRRAARRAAGGSPARRLVAQIGRFAMEKDWPTFLRAAAIIAAEFPDVDFLAVGDGTRRQELEALAAGLGLTGRICFTGPRDDVPALLASVDVLALSSITEGFPNVLLEAMATGAVAVATDVGGCREIVSSGETGFLVPPRAPAAMAVTVGRVLHDGALARQVALAARRRVESELAVDVMAERTMGFYRSLLRVNRGPATIAAA